MTEKIRESNLLNHSYDCRPNRTTRRDLLPIYHNQNNFREPMDVTKKYSRTRGRKKYPHFDKEKLVSAVAIARTVIIIVISGFSF